MSRRRNVLTKIVIPQLVATIKYILSEVEEKEREDSFRLKRFKQLKLRRGGKEALHICCCCLAMFGPEEDTTAESICPVCKKAARAKGRQSEIKLNVIPCKSAVARGKENKKLLQHLMSHVDDVIELTRQYKKEGLLSPSMDRFLRTCNQYKDKLEDAANAPPICDVCCKLLTGSNVKVVNKKPSSKLDDLGIDETCECKLPKKDTLKGSATGTDSTYEIRSGKEDKLGYFEKKFKEIVKVTRLQNEDGSVSEEKQVITIRSERRNPRKTAMFDDMRDDNNPRPGDGNFYGDGGDDVGGDKGPNHRNMGPRGTKSEHSSRSHQMGEPMLRSCLSTANQKPSNVKSSSVECCVSKTSLSTCKSCAGKTKRACLELPKVTQSSSIDSHICCPKKTASVCGSELGSGPKSAMSLSSNTSSSRLKQTSLASPKVTKSSSDPHVCFPKKSASVCAGNLGPGSASQMSIPEKPASTSASCQTCTTNISVKKPMDSKGTCCLPKSSSTKTCPENKGSLRKTISTDAIWRDAWTSTTDLLAVPSRQPSKRSSPVSCSRQSDEYVEEEVEEKKEVPKKSSCCTIKIIAKPKACCFDDDKPKDDEGEKEVVIKGSMYETLKRIVLPPAKSSESFTSKKEEPMPDIKNICKTCLSKLGSGGVSMKSSMKSGPSIKSISSSCKKCQANIEPEKKLEKKGSCSCCGSLPNSSLGSVSCKNMAVGSETTAKSASHHEQKHNCCLAKKKSQGSDEEDVTTCCAMAQTSSKTSCCSKKKTDSVCCPSKKSSNTSLKSRGSSTKSTGSGSCFSDKSKDAGTCTKRSNRFDVRSGLRPTRRKMSLQCTCKSDTYMLKGSGIKRPVKRTQSCYEEDYFFRW